MGAFGLYWKQVFFAFSSLKAGFYLTFRHGVKALNRRRPKAVSDPSYFTGYEGIVTVRYPHEHIPLPEHARYRLHNEIDDCIVCDKCVKICPVNCIDIEPVKSPGEFGKTSDGTPKRIYAAKFDIDMGKCCFCGLCTTVCPTECLTMTQEFGFSTFDIGEHTYAFSTMAPTEIGLRKKEWEAHVAQKTAMPPAETEKPTLTPGPAKPVFKPKVKPPGT